MKMSNVRPDPKFSSLVCILSIFLCQTAYAAMEGTQAKRSAAAPAVSQAIAQPTVIPPDPAAQGYTLAPGEKKFKRKLLASGYSINLDPKLTWMDEHRIIINYNADKQGIYDPGERGSRNQKKILVLNVDSNEVVDAPYEGNLGCYRDGRIAIYRVIFSENKNAGRKGSELALGKYGEPLQIPVPGGVPKDLTLNEQTCQLEPKDPAAEKKRRLRAWGGGVSIENEKVKPVNDPSVDLGRFDKSNIFFGKMNVAQKEKWIWHDPDGLEKEIETNIGEIFTGGGFRPVYLPFEGGAYYFRTRMDTTLPAHVFIDKFNRLIYPDGKMVRLPVPDILWRDYVMGGGRVGLGSWYTKAGVIWGKGASKNSALPSGFYLEDKKNKQLVKLENIGIRDATLFPDGCRMLNQEKAENGGFADYYIINLCTGE
jgi:hypothetical protein